MAVRRRRTRAALTNRAYNNDVLPENRLAFIDQALFAGHRAAGIKEVVQCVWVYEHAIDFDGLKRFHDNLSHGLLARRIERSTLPFGRHHWVSDPGPLDIDIAGRARPRAVLSDWADERSQLPVDAEWGPGWHLGVLPLTDGSTAVSLVASHYLIDGLGLAVVLVDALLGNTRDLGYPPPRSRTRRRAVAQDARQATRELPDVGRALAAAAREARSRRQENHGSPPRRSVAAHEADGDDIAVVPGVTMCVDLDAWARRAITLGGTSHTLAAGLAAKLAERMGRLRASDGAVTLQLPLSERAEGDTRAIAVAFARVSVDPTLVTEDLRDVRAAIKQELTTLRESPTEASQLLPLVPFTRKRTLKRAVDAAFADPDRPVFCSNIGDVGSLVNRLDGTDAEYAYARGTRQHVTRQWLERIGGQLQMLSLRLPDKIVIHVLAFQPGAENTKTALRDLAAETLAEFSLTGMID